MSRQLSCLHANPWLHQPRTSLHVFTAGQAPQCLIDSVRKEIPQASSSSGQAKGSGKSSGSGSTNAGGSTGVNPSAPSSSNGGSFQPGAGKNVGSEVRTAIGKVSRARVWLAMKVAAAASDSNVHKSIKHTPWMCILSAFSFACFVGVMDP